MMELEDETRLNIPTEFKYCIGLQNERLIDFAVNFYGSEIWINGELRGKSSESSNYYGCFEKQALIPKDADHVRCQQCFRLERDLWGVKSRWTKNHRRMKWTHLPKFAQEEIQDLKRENKLLRTENTNLKENNTRLTRKVKQLNKELLKVKQLCINDIIDDNIKQWVKEEIH